jgi:hypothetical protein
MLVVAAAGVVSAVAAGCWAVYCELRAQVGPGTIILLNDIEVGIDLCPTGWLLHLAVIALILGVATLRFRARRRKPRESEERPTAPAHSPSGSNYPV